MVSEHLFVKRYSCLAGSREGCREQAQLTIMWALKALHNFLSWWIFLPLKGQNATLFLPPFRQSAFKCEFFVFVFLPWVSSFSYFTIIKSRFLFTHAVALFFPFCRKSCIYLFIFFIVTVKIKFAFFLFTLTFQCRCAISGKYKWEYSVHSTFTDTRKKAWRIVQIPSFDSGQIFSKS